MQIYSPGSASVRPPSLFPYMQTRLALFEKHEFLTPSLVNTRTNIRDRRLCKEAANDFKDPSSYRLSIMMNMLFGLLFYGN